MAKPSTTYLMSTSAPESTRGTQQLTRQLHDWELPDPGLTEKGIEQCKALAAEFESRLPFSLEECRILTSPLRRTLQTVDHALPRLRDRGVPIEVRAEWQETTDRPCDVGREVSLSQAEWPNLDYSNLDPVYPQKIGIYGASEETLLKRAAWARKLLSQRTEKCIIVVTHSGFLRRVVEGPRFINVEYRAYTTVTDDSTGEVELRETRLDGVGDAGDDAALP